MSIDVGLMLARFARRARAEIPVNPHTQKYFCFSEPRIGRIVRASRLEGRIAVVTTREAGMRWTRTRRLTSGVDADGEAVWSWRAHASAK